MIKQLIFLTGTIFCSISLAQGQSIRWTDPEHLADSLRAERRPLFVLVYTDWCKYCHLQEHIINADTRISKQLNQQYYCLKLNAESNESIHFLGRDYVYDPMRGYHALAEYLGKQNEELVFPTLVFVSPNLNVFRRFQGVQNLERIQVIIKE